MSDPMDKSDSAELKRLASLAEARKQRLEAEKSAVDAELALHEAQMKLAAARAPLNNHAIALKATKAATEKFNAEKELLAARQGAVSSMIDGVPDSGIKGDVELTEKAGSLEMSLLTAVAIREAARKIASELGACVNKTSALEVVLEGQLTDLKAALGFVVQRDQVEAALNHALDNVEEAKRTFLTGTSEESTATANRDNEESVLGVAMTSLAAVASYFRSDFKAGGSDVSFDESVLLHAVLSNLGAIATVRAPCLFAVPNWAAVGQFLRDQLRECTSLRIRAEAASITCEKAIANSANHPPAASAFGAAREGLTTAVSMHDALLSRFSGNDDAAAALRHDLMLITKLNDPNAYVLVLKLQRSGGSFYVEKNVLTSIGKMPFSVAGGAVVTFSLFTGADGIVKASGVVCEHGGFMKVQEVPARCAASSPTDRPDPDPTPDPDPDPTPDPAHRPVPPQPEADRRA